MKYSIFIHPNTEKSSAASHAINFINALLRKKHQITGVFFYGHAVNCAFNFDLAWQNIFEQNIKISACSTIAENYLENGQTVMSYVKLNGLGQWMDDQLTADKRIEFV